jgi:exonuclease VII large subunit
VVSRGGGENMEVFDKPSLASIALTLNSFFITAIGHKQDISLLQKVADKAFITPTAFGQYLNDIYNDTLEELQNSKAQLVESVTKQLQTNYEKQVQNLEEKLKATEELNSKQVDLYKSQIESLASQYQNQIKELDKVGEQKANFSLSRISDLEAKLAQAKNYKLISWVLVLIAIVLGIIVGRSCR